MRIFDLALKDMLQIFRDWKAALFLFIMPIGFTLVFGFAFGGSGDQEADIDQRIPIGIVDQDGSELTFFMIELMNQSNTIRPVIVEENLSMDEIKTMVDEDKFSAVIVITPEYTDGFLNGNPEQLTTILKPDTSRGATAQNSIQAVTNRLLNSSLSAQFSTAVKDQKQPFATISEKNAYYLESFERAVSTWESPPFELFETQTGRTTDDNGGAEEAENAFSHSSPGMMVQFAIAGLIGAATVIVLERKTGSMKRLLTTSITRPEILLGHFLAMFMMILIQFTILIGFAAIFLDVGYFREPLATIVITLTTTFFTASMGLLIGTLAKSEEQAVMYSLIPMFILSGLGGAWVPLEFTNETFQTIGHFTPIAWAMDGFQNIVTRGMGIESVITPALVLFGFGAVCFALAVWRFKFE